MANYNADPNPNDPRVQEEIQEAVKRARQSVYGAYLSEDGLTNAASGYFSDQHGGHGNATDIDIEIRREVHRQMESVDTRNTDRQYGVPSAPVHTDLTESDVTTPVVSHPPRDPVMDFVVDHWLDDAEIYSMRGSAAYQPVLMENRYDPTAPAEFYRGYITALVALFQAVRFGDSLQRYRNLVDQTQAMNAWPGDSDQIGGVNFAMMNAWEYSKIGVQVFQIVPHLRGEIACIAECFHLSRARGL
jgi:hypothetical protein